MLITLKTLQEDLFTVEVDPSDTVKHFKENIEKAKGDAFPAKYTKLMYAGKFLIDSKQVCDYGLEEKKFVILVVKKPLTPVVKEEEPDSTGAPVMNANASTSSAAAEVERILCAEHEELVQHIVELGFTRNDVERALCASFNNPDRAVEYLIGGARPGPSGSNRPTASQSRPAEDPLDTSDAALLRHMTRPSPPDALSCILPSQDRIFELFSQAVADYENSREERMQESGSDLMSQAFAGMGAGRMFDPNNCEDMSSGSESSEEMSTGMPSGMPGSMFNALSGAFSGIGGIGSMSAMPSPLTDRDHEAIERLKQLGFPDIKVIEAYFVCDRDENAAAEYLFSQRF